MNLYGFVFNDALLWFDVLGREPTPTVGDPSVIPDSNGSGPTIPLPGQPGYVDPECLKKRAVIVKWAKEMVGKGSGKTPDCSGEKGCEMITLVIDLGDPCLGWENDPGHTGGAVGDDYYDTTWGGGEYWRMTSPTLSNLNKAIPDGDTVIAIEWCMCDMRAEIEKVFKSLYEEGIATTQCNAQVCAALGFGTLGMNMLRSPRSLASTLTGTGMEEAPSYLPQPESALPISDCGKSKGDSANVRILHQPNLRHLTP